MVMECVCSMQNLVPCVGVTKASLVPTAVQVHHPYHPQAYPENQRVHVLLEYTCTAESSTYFLDTLADSNFQASSTYSSTHDAHTARFGTASYWHSVIRTSDPHPYIEVGRHVLAYCILLVGYLLMIHPFLCWIAMGRGNINFHNLIKLQ